MFKIAVVLTGALAFGFALAYPLIAWPIKVGYLGFAVMLASAWAARVHWDRRRERVGDEPGAPEREVWHCMAANAVVGGHLLGVLVQPGFDMHSVAGHAHAVDNWTLIGGAVASYFVLHNSGVKQDERDRAIAARAANAGYWALVAMIVVLLLILGFAPRHILAPLTHQVLAHVLIEILVAATLVQSAVQLIGYRRDALPAGEEPAGPR